MLQGIVGRVISRHQHAVAMSRCLCASATDNVRRCQLTYCVVVARVKSGSLSGVWYLMIICVFIYAYFLVA